MAGAGLRAMAVPALAAVGVALTAGGASAQHAPTLKCASCHVAHGGAPGTSNIPTAPSARQQLFSATAGGPVGAASVLCLECHTAQPTRETPGGLLRSAPIGPSLTDDHPLGIRTPDDPTAVPSPYAFGADLRSGRLAPIGPASSSTVTIECASCHDPHDPATDRPSTADAQRVCGTCHDRSTYRANTHVTSDCGACHDLHGGASSSLLREEGGSRVCATCHTVDPRHTKGQPTPPARPDISLRALARPAPGSCMECHEIHR